MIANHKFRLRVTDYFHSVSFEWPTLGTAYFLYKMLEMSILKRFKALLDAAQASDRWRRLADSFSFFFELVGPPVSSCFTTFFLGMFGFFNFGKVTGHPVAFFSSIHDRQLRHCLGHLREMDEGRIALN